MHRFGGLAFAGALLVGFASAQSTTLSAATTYLPTPVWTIPNGACNQGAQPTTGPAPYTGGGVFRKFEAIRQTTDNNG